MWAYQKRAFQKWDQVKKTGNYFEWIIMRFLCIIYTLFTSLCYIIIFFRLTLYAPPSFKMLPKNSCISWHYAWTETWEINPKPSCFYQTTLPRFTRHECRILVKDKGTRDKLIPYLEGVGTVWHLDSYRLFGHYLASYFNQMVNLVSQNPRALSAWTDMWSCWPFYVLVT